MDKFARRSAVFPLNSPWGVPLFLMVFTPHFLYFNAHLGCPVCVASKDSILSSTLMLFAGLRKTARNAETKIILPPRLVLRDLDELTLLTTTRQMAVLVKAVNRDEQPLKGLPNSNRVSTRLFAPYCSSSIVFPPSPPR